MQAIIDEVQVHSYHGIVVQSEHDEIIQESA